MDYWALWRQGRTDWSPVVVLNQPVKAKQIREQPFSLAYEIFRQRLLTANRWLIAGTSLQDAGVCAMLRRAWSGRRALPQDLLITKGQWLHICRDGMLASATTVFLASRTRQIPDFRYARDYDSLLEPESGLVQQGLELRH